jgi:hypothetical protein
LPQSESRAMPILCHSPKLKHLLVLTLCVVASPGSAQSSLATQQERCDRLRDEVEDARRELDRAESARAAQDRSAQNIERMARAGGKSEAQISVARTLSSSFDINVDYPRRKYQGSMERYNMQGCATGGQAVYNYDATGSSGPTTEARASAPAARPKPKVEVIK